MKAIIKSPARCGLTTVKLIPNFQGFNTSCFWKGHEKYFSKNWAIVINHNGNMGNTVKRSIDPNLKIIFDSKLISVDKINKHCFEYKESGSPDYSYTFYGILNVEKLIELEK
jgi:hypothetical protein